MNIRASVVVGLLAFTFGCEPSEPQPQAVTVRDSAGITIIESVEPVWGAGEGWALSPVPDVVIGTVEGDERYLLTDVRGARRFPDGRIAVLDVGSYRVRVYDADGVHLFDLGGEGDGPSEFRTPQYLHLIDDTLVVYEYFPGSATWFSPDGRFIRTRETPRPADGSIIRGMTFGVLEGRAVAVGLPDNEYFEGVNRHPDPLWRFELDGPSLDSLGSMEGFEQVIEFPRPGVTRHRQFIFGKSSLIAVSDRWIYTASSESFSVRVLDSDGVLRRIVRRPIDARPVQSGDLDRFVAQRIAEQDVPPDERALWERELRETLVADTMPLIRSLAVDSDENLWVEEWHDVGLSQGAFSVFSDNGTWLGSVSLPDGLAANRGRIIFAPWLEIGANYLLGVWVDELGVEQVRLYQILKE